MKYISLLSLGLICACASIKNPAATSFNAAKSDAKAIVIADQVMTANGGRKAWDATHYIAWDFFGARYLTWDKQSSDVHIHIKKDNVKMLFNLKTMKGSANKNGTALEGEDLTKTLEKGRKIWINDSYWLVMPFKLKDDGVTLRYVKEDKSADNQPCDVLQLTFEQVGVTPENKYYVFVDKVSHLVAQWQFFGKASDEKPQFTNPWLDYTQHGSIKLSGNRGREEGNLTDIKVDAEVDISVLKGI